MSAGPHAGQPLLARGAPADGADLALILLHGRGAPAASMAPLADALTEGLGAQVAVRMPQAAGGVWYPQRFVAPRGANQPWLDGALARVAEVAAELEAAGVPQDRIVLAGFSQGACLTLDAFAARGGYGGAIAFAGGLIGESLEPDRYAPDLRGAPVFVGSADPDPHIPTGRVEASAELLRERGARVDARLYPGLGHTVNEDQLEAGRALLREVLEGAPA